METSGVGREWGGRGVGRVSSQGSHCAALTPRGRLRVGLRRETSLETAAAGNEIRNKLDPWQHHGNQHLRVTSATKTDHGVEWTVCGRDSGGQEACGDPGVSKHVVRIRVMGRGESAARGS